MFYSNGNFSWNKARNTIDNDGERYLRCTICWYKKNELVYLFLLFQVEGEKERAARIYIISIAWSPLLMGKRWRPAALRYLKKKKRKWKCIWVQAKHFAWDEIEKSVQKNGSTGSINPVALDGVRQRSRIAWADWNVSIKLKEKDKRKGQFFYYCFCPLLPIPVYYCTLLLLLS